MNVSLYGKRDFSEVIKLRIDPFFIDHAEMNKKDVYGHMATILLAEFYNPLPSLLSSSLLTLQEV